MPSSSSQPTVILRFPTLPPPPPLHVLFPAEICQVSHKTTQEKLHQSSKQLATVLSPLVGKLQYDVKVCEHIAQLIGWLLISPTIMMLSYDISTKAVHHQHHARKCCESQQTQAGNRWLWRELNRRQILCEDYKEKYLWMLPRMLGTRLSRHATKGNTTSAIAECLKDSVHRCWIEYVKILPREDNMQHVQRRKLKTDEKAIQIHKTCTVPP